jgi:parallel beta-helix repeat protein
MFIVRIASAAGVIALMSTAAIISAGAAMGHASGGHAPAQIFHVNNLDDSGSGSLRAAIDNANALSPGASAAIHFSVNGIIKLASQLPAISRMVTVDATSAPTHVSGGPPVVEINCNGKEGLSFGPGSGGSQLLGVAVDNASSDGITLGAGSITLNDDYVGLNLAGAVFGNGGDGVHVWPTSSRNQIGLNATGASGVVGNVISGNAGSGIDLSGSSLNTIAANRIGTNPAGTSAIANGQGGIAITAGSNRNEIGGTEFVDSATGQANNPTGSKGTVTPVFVVPPQGNLISGNDGDGVLIDGGSQNNVLNGNFIGTTADGDAPLGNTGDGVWINNSANNSLIGCKFVNNPFVYYNVVSGNDGDGVHITNSNNAVVQGNFFGVGANNAAIVGNSLDGILVDGTSANSQVGGVIPLGNVSSGNGQNGIEVADQAQGFTTFNTFGGLVAFGGAAPNGRDGLLVTSTGGDNLARTNVFSGNTQNGIELAGQASGVTIDPDIAGLSTSGKAALPNGGDGVLVDGNAHDNTIGGSFVSVIPQNTFSGNAGYGLVITGNAHDNQVFSSYIGTEILGVNGLGNQTGGVLIGGTVYGNSIGSFDPPSNLIGGNTGNGVTLLPGACYNSVVNNYIGLNRFGNPLPNTGQQLVNVGCRNTIAGNRIYQQGPVPVTG